MMHFHINWEANGLLTKKYRMFATYSASLPISLPCSPNDEGPGTFEMASDPDFYADHYEFQVPIFAITA